MASATPPPFAPGSADSEPSNDVSRGTGPDRGPARQGLFHVKRTRNSPEDRQRVRAVVYGTVQGVGFRYTVRQTARRLGLAGYVASRGDATIYGMVLAATIGSLVGALILYGFAAAVGPYRLRAIVIRYGTWIGFSESDLDRTEAWFDRRSRYAVLICRCIPLIRSLISIPAGFRRMPLTPFIIFTTIGSLVWNTILVSAGYALGEQWDRVLDYTEPFQDVVREAEAVRASIGLTGQYAAVDEDLTGTENLRLLGQLLEFIAEHVHQSEALFDL